MALSHQGKPASREKEASRLAAAHAYYLSQISEMFAPSALSSKTKERQSREGLTSARIKPLAHVSETALADKTADGSAVRASVQGGAGGRSSVPTGAPRTADSQFYTVLGHIVLAGIAQTLDSARLPAVPEERDRNANLNKEIQRSGGVAGA